MRNLRTRQQIIADLKEANEALEITTYDSLNVEADATWLYVDKNNGDDAAAAQYFIDNPAEVHNFSVPFASYAGVEGAIEFWEQQKAASDARFVDKWPILIDLSENGVWSDTVPTNEIGTSTKPLIWAGFTVGKVGINCYYNVADHNVFIYLKNSGTTKADRITNVGTSAITTHQYFFSHLSDVAIGADGTTPILQKKEIFLYETKFNNVIFNGTHANYREMYRAVSSVIVNYTVNNWYLSNLSKSTQSLFHPILIKNTITDCPFEDLTNLLYVDHNAYLTTQMDTGQDENSLFEIDPEFIDLEQGILYVKPSSPTLKAGTKGKDIGLGMGYAQRNADLNYLLPEFSKGTLQNADYDANGKIFVEYTGVAVMSATSNTLTLPASSPDADDYFNTLKLRTYDASGTLVDEFTITDYDGATRTLTIDGTFTTTPDTNFKAAISAIIESTVMNYEMELDKIFISEIQKHDDNGDLENGTETIFLKTSELLNGGRIPESGDVDYDAALHDYKQQHSESVRVDANGYGSAESNFDPSTGSRISCKFIQLKMEVW